MHYTANNKESDLSEDLDIFDKGTAEKWGQKIIHMDGGWICFRRQVSYRDRLLALFSAERTTALRNDCANKKVY